MKTRMIVMALALLVVFGLIFGFIGYKRQMINEFLADMSLPPVTVASATVSEDQWASYLKAVGTLKAVNGVDLMSETEGVVRKLHFESGQQVIAGAPLFQLDDRVEKANLKSLQAQLKLAEINYARDKRLLGNRAISKTDFDKVNAQLKDVQAQVERTKVYIAQKLVKAPFDGRLGISEVNLGQYVKKGDHLVTLQALDSLHVDFSVPEQYLPKLTAGQVMQCWIQAYPDKVFNGVISAVNAKVDDNTRNVWVRAVIENQDATLIPGMFANVQITVDEPRTVLTVPETAISYNLFGNVVYQIAQRSTDESKTELYVEQVFVEVEESRDKRVAVSGLEAGQEIVAAGQLKLNQGDTVVINNSVEL